MVAANKFATFVTDMAAGTHANALNASTDTLNVYLSNTAPSATAHSVKADLAEIATGNGYTGGGQDTTNLASTAAGVITVGGTDVTWTATGGTIGPFRYVPLYNDTPAGPVDPLIQWWDYGSAVTLNAGESFTVDFATAGSGGMFTVS